MIQGGSCLQGLQLGTPQRCLLEGGSSAMQTGTTETGEGQKAVNTCTEPEDFCSFLFIIIRHVAVFLKIEEHTVEITTKHSQLLGYK